jgi:phytoene synthase
LPISVRAAVAALWLLDLAFADIASTTSDQRLGEIRLAWWRERLEDLDSGSSAPAEPRLQAVARELLPRGVTGQELSELEDAWLPALQPFPWSREQAEGFRRRGRILFGVGVRLLGEEPSLAMAPGELWSLIDGAMHCSDISSRGLLISEARSIDVTSNVPRGLRPITISAAVAVAHVRAPTSGRVRGIAAAVHRLTGRIAKISETGLKLPASQ